MTNQATKDYKKRNPEKYGLLTEGTPRPILRNEKGQLLPGSVLAPRNKVSDTRKHLTKAFLEAMADDFEEHGVKAIQQARLLDPVAYVKVIAGMLPKQVEVDNKQDMAEDELNAQLRRLLASDLATVVEGRENRTPRIIDGERAPEATE